MWELGGLWKHRNNPACTKTVSLQSVKVRHYKEEDKEEEGK